MAVAFRRLSGFRVYCDESNTDGRKRHPVYGAILVSLDNIREVQKELADWRRTPDGIQTELKWQKGVHGGLGLKQYKSLVDLLFRLIRQRKLLQFKAIILDRRAPEYHAYSKGNYEIGFYKTYYHWLLWYFAKFPLRHRCKLRVIIDDRNLPKDAKDPFTKLKFALNNGIRKELDQTADDVVTEVKPLDSKLADLLQVADVLMGAVAYHNQDFHLRPEASKAKVELAKYIALKVGQRDLKRETHPLREDFKIVRWYWPGQERERYRRRAADNPRPSSRRPKPGK
jgi:hypothetical protein